MVTMMRSFFRPPLIFAMLSACSVHKGKKADQTPPGQEPQKPGSGGETLVAPPHQVGIKLVQARTTDQLRLQISVVLANGADSRAIVLDPMTFRLKTKDGILLSPDVAGMINSPAPAKGEVDESSTPGSVP